MSTIDLALTDWLRAQRHFKADRDLWWELVRAHCAAAALVHGYIRPYELEHGLTVEEADQLMQLLEQESPAATAALGCILAGAEPETVVDFLSNPGPSAPEGGWGMEAHTNAVVHALHVNPRLQNEHLFLLETADVVSQSWVVLTASHWGSQVSLGSNDGFKEVFDELFATLVDAFGYDRGAWMLFFELWSGPDYILKTATDWEVCRIRTHELIEAIQGTL